MTHIDHTINLDIRAVQREDLPAILTIYNQGIEDRIATLESETKDQSYIEAWFEEHQDRYTALIAQRHGTTVGWAAINRYSHRCAYDAVADLSIYVTRDARGTGVGSQLLASLEQVAQENKFRKIILFTFPFNYAGQGLYRKQGYRVVGTFEKQGVLDGKLIDVMIMEKVL
ncbi:arsinothricin resistance N-acetyltransferase ArsN1 family A [Paenibacillus hunanensis]|uniref:Phosphinothricin acetyltransferase n=1 Tax=Paenibacillus hunanensis TaxID=539262 RepID=A0ABU1ISV6_9BACL|nr:arsinothricin resistance N-acetyltransferase ArsN1 family A [Paenibacillus hunanensis]MDR6242339.1 phosphinothricin acetyltransferase [Paenibacillus hunanensis]WPP39459.1 arsinothricin resistance N-acetyltransferase ArsN1 family A [Paenibacillus hunanensis]GGJ07097.1 N-acetyltransferase [Paenibacillus hunanensis]